MNICRFVTPDPDEASLDDVNHILILPEQRLQLTNVKQHPGLGGVSIRWLPPLISFRKTVTS